MISGAGRLLHSRRGAPPRTRTPWGVLASLGLPLILPACAAGHALARDPGATTIIYVPAAKDTAAPGHPTPIVYTTVEDSSHLDRGGEVLARRVSRDQMELLLDRLQEAGLEDLPESRSPGAPPPPQTITIESAGAVRRWESPPAGSGGPAGGPERFYRCVIVIIQGARSDPQVGSGYRRP